MRNINWFDTLSTLGILIGIVLVVLQLQQNEKLIRYQIATELRINRDAERMLVRDEDFAEVLAKLEIAPDTLTDTELVQFDMHARSLLGELDLREMLTDVGIFEAGWQSWLVVERCETFDNPVGRTWLKTAANYEPVREMVKGVEAALPQCQQLPSFLEAMREQQ